MQEASTQLITEPIIAIKYYYREREYYLVVAVGQMVNRREQQSELRRKLQQ